MSRKLATVRRIDAIDPIEGADAIDVATVGGWKVVVQKGIYNVGDLAVYLEIDSWVPATVAPFLFKGRSYNDVEGERLRTIKLRGQISQGLLLPLVSVYDHHVDSEHDDGQELCEVFFEGADISDILGIQKWEKPIPGSLSGTVKGNFPSFVRKTDQERIQNLKRELAQWIECGVTWEVTEKLDGSSMTVYLNNDTFGVCSRNYDLAGPESEFYRENTFWETAKRLDLEKKIRSNVFWNIAIQGELIGSCVQGNKLRLKENEFRVFDIWDIDNQCYVPPKVRQELIERLGLEMAPVCMRDVVLFPECEVQNLLSLADGPSALGNKSAREGLVWKSSCGRYSFKTISNKWLLKNGDE